MGVPYSGAGGVSYTCVPVSLSLGIVGLPNVGKSTLFNALTRNNVVAANYPFATIEPNEGVVPLPDPRLDKLAEMFDSEKIVPAPVTFVDIAGIVKGASEGAGLGNKFLANIRECDAICQVVRVFADDDVVHVDGKVDPRTTWQIASHSRMLARNLLPRPAPSEAPFTIPAMSTKVTGAGTIFSESNSSASLFSRGSGSGTTPSFGSMVAKG